MFSKGDIVVCVDPGKYELTLGKQYVVIDYKDNGFVNLGTLPGEFFEHRFILLEDWREQQLNKIL